MASVPLSDVYVHIRIVISMIVGLCITALLAGFARFVQHPRREHISLLHLGWAASMLIWVIHFWWWEFRLSAVEHWTFGLYLFIILYATLYYLICKLLFPDDIKGYSGYEEYFLSAAAGSLACLPSASSPITSIPPSKAPHIYIPLESNIPSGWRSISFFAAWPSSSSTGASSSPFSPHR